ncbi:hypothetical protein JOF53_006106 [Crossiella equi]|uniref:AAA+ ATPase domain-containing protein n=1 Tax=Crossiella equi TaxID=130796 RepID=A0ABS5ALY6_9PSEU|nr:hypothetical protein [Crossiella equi]MBP2477234.1 hypothetical protein [Crossiella equi]
MLRALTYADAVRLLGGKESRAVTWLDRLTSTAMLGTAPFADEVLGWFDAKADLVKHGHDLVNGLSDRVRGLRRFDRTQRLAAAHAVLVTLAFVEAFRELDFRPDPEEVLDPKLRTRALVSSLLDADVPLPAPQRPYADNLQALSAHYSDLCTELLKFVSGLAVWDRWDERRRDLFIQATRQLVGHALTRYQELFRQLAVDCPELAFWSGLNEHSATQHLVRTGLADLQTQLVAIATGRAPDDRRADLARGYQARLDVPVIEPGEVPAGFRIPALHEAYVAPRYRVQGIGPGAALSQEPWWEEIPVREDVEAFLLGHLTSPQATRGPLLVLGQPGSGKSMLTHVLAARLPPTDFLPVRVPLREVAAESDVQTQVEQAIRQRTGYRLDWPDLSRSAGDALPVVLLDGFDELLQATGVSQSDYLDRVRAFQQREAEQGRPVAVLVTTRTSVADRARVPDGSVALRLEPFDPPRTTRWLTAWDAPLTPEVALRHPDLASQPLLLLMLTLYVADGGTLDEADLAEGELYERLLHRFAEREVRKTHAGLPDKDLAAAVEHELRRLSVVAFGMFNRGQQWITEPDLDADLTALLGVRATPRTGSRSPLGQAESTLGRFFFIHRAEAHRDDDRLRTYEFLHATFGEYLVARFTWQALTALNALAAATAANPFATTPLDDGFLHALLSQTPLSNRVPVLTFLTEFRQAATPEHREQLTALVLRLYRTALLPHPHRTATDYQPQVRTAPARHGLYRANLLLLLVVLKHWVHGSELYGEVDDVVRHWRGDVLLWRGQLTAEEWTGLADQLTLERKPHDIALALGHLATPPPVPAHWPEPWPSLEELRRHTHLQCGFEDLYLHILEPLLEHLPETTRSAGERERTLLDLLTLTSRPDAAQVRGSAYDDYIRAATHPTHPELSELVRLDHVLTLLGADHRANPNHGVEAMNLFVRGLSQMTPRWHEMEERALHHALALLGRDPVTDLAVGSALTPMLAELLASDPTPPLLEVLVKLTELEALPDPDQLTDFEPTVWADLAQARPDLARRAEAAWQRQSPQDPWPYSRA